MSQKSKPVLPSQVDVDMYRDSFLLMLPLLAMAVYLYGARPAVLCAVAVVTANLCDRLVALLRRKPYERHEMSSESFALLVAMLLPASVDYYVLIVAVLAAVLVGKEAFGGYGAYPFHPAAVGYVVAAVSWPEQVFRFPVPFAALPLGGTDGVQLVESASAVLKSGGLPTTSTLDLLLGDYAGPMGTTFNLVILSCLLYLLARRKTSLVTPACFLLACAAVAYLAPRLGDIPLSWPWQYAGQRLEVLKFEMLSGAVLYSAVFLVNEPVTLPKNGASRAVYGLLLGFTSMMFRYFGTYETGVCFALLAVNAVSGWLDRVVTGFTAHRKEVRPRES